MPSLAYWALTVGESVLSTVGIRSAYEQPHYDVVARLPHDVEIRQYGPRTVVETQTISGRDSEAFTRLFRYITGANTQAGASRDIAMTIPVETAPDGALRFFLPRALAASPPTPTDPLVHIVALPAGTVAARRFSGTLSRDELARQQKILRSALIASGWHATGPAARFGYDPPFTPPFLRRNEVVLPVAR